MSYVSLFFGLFFFILFQHPFGHFARARICDDANDPHACQQIPNFVSLLSGIQRDAELVQEKFVDLLAAGRTKLGQVIGDLFRVELIVLTTRVDVIGFGCCGGCHSGRHIQVRLADNISTLVFTPCLMTEFISFW